MIDRFKPGKEAPEETESVLDVSRKDYTSDLDILREHIDELERRYGIIIPEEIKQRQVELEVNAKEHNRDARVIYEAFFQVFHLLRKMKDKPEYVDLPDLSEQDLGIGLAASLLHDIGKSGGPKFSSFKQRIVSRLYNITNISKEASVKEAVIRIVGDSQEMKKGNTPFDKLEAYLQELDCVGLAPNDLMAALFRKHAEWTEEILETYLDQDNPIYRRITKIASAHHYLEHYKSEKVDLGATKLSEEERRDLFILKMLIVLDQYQAVRHRGHKEPAAAFIQIQEALKMKGVESDPEFQAILQLVKKTDASTAVFELGGKIPAEIKR